MAESADENYLAESDLCFTCENVDDALWYMAHPHFLIGAAEDKLVFALGCFIINVERTEATKVVLFKMTPAIRNEALARLNEKNE